MAATALPLFPVFPVQDLLWSELDTWDDLPTAVYSNGVPRRIPELVIKAGLELEDGPAGLWRADTAEGNPVQQERTRKERNRR